MNTCSERARATRGFTTDAQEVYTLDVVSRIAYNVLFFLTHEVVFSARSPSIFFLPVMGSEQWRESIDYDITTTTTKGQPDERYVGCLRYGNTCVGRAASYICG